MDAKFIWADEKGEGRNAYAAFRHSFVCSALPAKAIINIFADSAYHLYVNGKFVNFGPARFNPKFPEYDSYDISEMLVEGKNALSVLVNHFGVKTYKSVETGAGLIAWGEVLFKNGEKIFFDSGKTKWKVFEIEAYDRNAPKLSFALNPMEIYTQSNEPLAWKETNYDDSAWKDAVVLKDQGRWGKLSPRSIPFMSGTQIKPEKLLGVYPLENNEKNFSFKVPTIEFYNRKHGDSTKQYILFKTWLHSPKKQSTVIGLFWGEHWLNGKELTERIQSENSSLRYNYRVSLEAGWNFFFGYVGVYLDEFAFYINLPSDSGVEPYAERNLSCPYSFSYTEVVNQANFDTLSSKFGLPLPPDFNGDLKWNLWERNKTAGNPGRDTDLDFYGERFEQIELDELSRHIFRKDDYPHGFAVLLDIGKTCLFRVGIELDGAKGATVDFAFSERLSQSKPLLYLHHGYHASIRAMFSEDAISWESFHAYGGRYAAITFRNLKQDIQIKDIRFLSANYPVELKGSLNCSENVLNKIWQICVDTQKADMEDAYIDCPTRERGMYARDGIIQYFNNLALFGDHALMKRFLKLFAQNPAADGRMKAVSPIAEDYVIVDFSLNLVEGFYAYFINTGDKDFICEHWNAITKNLEWFDNLSDMHEGGILTLDWPNKKAKGYYGGFHGDILSSATKKLMCNAGLSCLFTCMYLCALKAAKSLALITQDSQKAKEYSARIKKVSENTAKQFWDNAKKCFSDDIEHTTHSVQANSLAVLADLPSKKQIPGIKAHLDESLKNFFINGYDAGEGVLVSPSFAFYIFEALYKIGLESRAEDIMIKGWGQTMLSQGLKTCREYFNRHHDSFCHAWSAHPAYFLSKYVLGVSYPHAPDFSKVVINPKTNSVKWAEGAYPHPNGLIHIRWKSNKNGKKIFKVKAPKGVKIQFGK